LAQFSNYRKFVTKLYKIWVWNPESGSRGQKAPDPGSRHATLVLSDGCSLLKAEGVFHRGHSRVGNKKPAQKNPPTKPTFKWGSSVLFYLI
jgi:hypothetical protein